MDIIEREKWAKQDQNSTAGLTKNYDIEHKTYNSDFWLNSTLFEVWSQEF